MTDKPLKTLKDFPAGYGIPECLVDKIDLKAEAIRKVKAIDGCVLGIQIMGRFHLRGPQLLAVRDYIVWQNNLTEADLE